MEKKNLTAEQFIEKLTTRYYEDKIDEYRQRISNLKMGYDEYHGIAKYAHIARKPLPPKERDARIAELENAIKGLRKQAQELGEAIRELRSSTVKLDALARKEALLHELCSALDELHKHAVTPENEPKFQYFQDTYTLWRRNRRTHLFGTKEEHRETKITKDMYKQLKQNQKKTAFEKGDSIQHVADENYLQLDSIGLSYFNSRRTYYLSEKYSGGKKQALELYRSVLEDKAHFDFHVTGISDVELDTVRKYSKYIEQLEKDYHLYSFRELGSYCYETIELAREVYYVENVIEMFSTTEINNTERYEEAKRTYETQRERLQALMNKTIKLAESKNIDDVIIAIDKLNDLYHIIVRKQHQLDTLAKRRQDGMKTNEEYELENEIRDLKLDMNLLLQKYPELNNYDYRTLLGNYAPKREEVQEEKKEENVQPEVAPKEEPVATEATPEEEMVDKVPEENVSPVTPDEEPQEEAVEEDVIILEEPEETIEKIETPDELHDVRFYHYQEYMKAKVVKSPLGKLPFSEYLRQTAPALKELIALEEQREKQAATIYKKYIQYRMQQGDKRSCMDFREFCDFRFDLDNVDVPVAYEEDEEKRRHR